MCFLGRGEAVRRGEAAVPCGALYILGGDCWDCIAGACKRSSRGLLQGLLGRALAAVSRVTFFFPFFLCLSCLGFCLFDVFVTPFCLGAGLSLAEDCLKASLVAA